MGCHFVELICAIEGCVGFVIQLQSHDQGCDRQCTMTESNTKIKAAPGMFVIGMGGLGG
jgi:hypothetical protein